MSLGLEMYAHLKMATMWLKKKRLGLTGQIECNGFQISQLYGASGENIQSAAFGTVQKNAAKRSRQYAGKKYREYAQRRVCFVNEQVP